MDDDVRHVGAFHDLAGPGAFLWRSGAREKRALRPGAMPRDCRLGHGTVVGSRVFTRVFGWLSIHWRIEVCVSAWGRFAAELRLFLLGFAECLRDVPTDVRYHHAGIDHRRCG